MFQSMLRDLVDGPAKTVWVRVGLPPDDIENLWLSEAPDPTVNSSFHLGTAAQVRTHMFRRWDPVFGCFIQLGTISTFPDLTLNCMQSSVGLSALAAAHFHFLRTGQEVEVHVDARHAILEFSKPAH